MPPPPQPSSTHTERIIISERRDAVELFQLAENISLAIYMIGARSRCSRTLCYTTSLYVPYGRPRSKTEETGRDGEGSRDTSDSDVFVVVAVKGQTSSEYW